MAVLFALGSLFECRILHLTGPLDHRQSLPEPKFGTGWRRGIRGQGIKGIKGIRTG
jgi:hypothetical protein